MMHFISGRAEAAFSVLFSMAISMIDVPLDIGDAMYGASGCRVDSER